MNACMHMQAKDAWWVLLCRCHRVVLAVLLRGLTGHVAVTMAIDDAERASRGGWVFNTPEPVYGAKDLRYMPYCLNGKRPLMP